MWGFEHLIKGGGDDSKRKEAVDADAETSQIWKRIADAQSGKDQEGDGQQFSLLGGGKDSSGRNNNQSFDNSEYCCGLCASLTFAERLLGCLLMHVGGYILDLGSLHRFMHLIHGSPLPFVATWTLGHTVCLLGTTFLVGPKKQLEGMFHESRKTAATAYIFTMALTIAILIVLLVLDRPTGFWVGLILVSLLLCQCACIAWYTISYIKFLYDFIMKKLDKLKKESSKSSNKCNTNDQAAFKFPWAKRNDYEEIV